MEWLPRATYFCFPLLWLPVRYSKLNLLCLHIFFHKAVLLPLHLTLGSSSILQLAVKGWNVRMKYRMLFPQMLRVRNYWGPMLSVHSGLLWLLPQRHHPFFNTMVTDWQNWFLWEPPPAGTRYYLPRKKINKLKRKKKDVQMVNLSAAKIEGHTCGQGEIDTVASQAVVSAQFSRCFSSHPSG